MTQMPPPPPTSLPPMDYRGELPGATAGLVLGICSIVFSGPILGLILGYLGFTKSRTAKSFAELNPGTYSNLGVAQAGYICSIIGLVLGGLSTVCGCAYFIIFAVAIAGGVASGGAGTGGGP